MIGITLNVNSGYDIATLNAKEICLFRKLIIMHIGQEAYIYIYIYNWYMNGRDLGFHSNFFSLLLILLKLSIYMFFFSFQVHDWHLGS